METKKNNCKPDNSIENCNICVKGIPLDMIEQEFEDYFSEKYGPVKSCKISKDPQTG
jgi:RNA recognition motif-containing protein